MAIKTLSVACPECGRKINCKATFAKGPDGRRIGLDFDTARCSNGECSVGSSSDLHIVNRAENAMIAAYAAAGVVDEAGKFPEGSPERR